MPTTSETKICRRCFSTIDARARKCPACHSLLGSGVLFAPALAILAIAATLAMLFGLTLLIEWSRRNPSEDFSADFSIVESTLYLGPQAFPVDGDERLCPTVVGRLKNNGTHDLDSIELQFHALNAEGKLIDVYQEYLSGPFKPGEEYAFKLTGAPIHLPQSDYVGHEVIVRGASHR
jgi:hypothetical protein